MLRAYLTGQKHCYLHTHRVVQTACARCKTPYCEECLEQRTDGLFARLVARDEKHPAPLFCRRCIEEVEVLSRREAERRRPLWQRLRPSREAIHRAAIYVAVICVALVPLSIAVRSMANTTLTPDEVARIKIGLLGGFQTKEGINYASRVYGGSFVRASKPSQPDHDPSHLIDTWATPTIPGWRSQDASFPQEMVFRLPSPLLVNKVILLPQPDEPEATWVRDFEVLVSTQSPDAGFAPVVSGTLDAAQARQAVDPERPGEPPRFLFSPVTARWVMLRVLSNNGSDQYTSLGEFEVYFSRT